MPLRHTLLGLLDRSPMHGYLLRQHAGESSWIYPMTNASIYPALHGLEREGLVEHSSEIHNGRARKIYRITDTGRSELQRWLAEPCCEPLTLRDPALLKLSMQSEETMRLARSWVERSLAELRELAEARTAQLQAMDEENAGRYARAVSEYGAEMLELRIRHLERLLEMGGRKA